MEGELSNIMRILALYLPQFHETEENNKWWGNGFTEWTTVRKATPLFSGHSQPIVPMGENYYDLLDYSVMEWQAELMNRYGLDGVCIYHYWFKNGKKILEKPAENLLRWKKIDINYCFSWANETWARTWSTVDERNTWTSIYETQTETQNGVLLEQKYGDKEEWKKHFNYLLPFFLDPRYIKVDNRPVMMFHKLKDIYCFENMIEVWNSLARDNGLGDIFIIGNQPRNTQKDSIDMHFVCEPGMAMQKINADYVDGVKCYEYEDIWKNILNEDAKSASIGGFVGYDDTPRHGKKGSVILNASSEKFKKHIHELITINKSNNHPFMFINAWNEWGEGMHLEPDMEFEYEYLEAFSDMHVNKESMKEVYVSRNYSIEEYTQMKEAYEKEKTIRKILDKWIYVSKESERLMEYIRSLGKVAVYGYGVIGKHLVSEVLELGGDIQYVIDKRDIQTSPVRVVHPESVWSDIDAVIVTPVCEYSSIYHFIRKKNKTIAIISIEYIINELLIQ